MSKLETLLPRALIRELEREIPQLWAVPVISIDPEGFPHVALLSFFEVLWQQGRLRFFVAASSRTTRFLKEQGKCTLLFVTPDFVCYVKGRSRFLAALDPWTVFQLEPTRILQDRPSKEEEAVLVSGIRFDSSAPALARRLETRRQIREICAVHGPG